LKTDRNAVCLVEHTEPSKKLVNIRTSKNKTYKADENESDNTINSLWWEGETKQKW